MEILTVYPDVFSIPALYIHIPFCSRLCPFCSFAIVKDHHQDHFQYTRGILKEIQLYRLAGLFPKIPAQSIYFGGGTPSRMGIVHLQEILEKIFQWFPQDSSTELSIELNPEDASLEYCTDLKSLGFSRVSIGIQSFHNPSLRRLRRNHSAEQSRQAVLNARKASFRNINLDMMFGFYSQSMKEVEQDTAFFAEYRPEHLSIYGLTIEEQTLLSKNSQWIEWIKKNESLIADMYASIQNTLSEVGYRQYEVSNFSLPGFESQQNLCYWSDQFYLGLGIGAHSYIASWRWENVRRPSDYYSMLENQKWPRKQKERMTRSMRQDEALMIGLRQIKGLNWFEFVDKFQIKNTPKLTKLLQELIRQGALIQFDGWLKPTSKGLLLADEITAKIASNLETNRIT